MQRKSLSKSPVAKCVGHEKRRNGGVMNPAGCPNGYATDNVFIVGPTCVTSMEFYVAMATVICAARFTASMFRFYDLWENIYRKKAKAQRMRNRLPLGAIFDVSSAIMYTLSFILVGLNVARYDNGGVLILYSLCFLPFAFGFSLNLYRMVRLGSKISPYLRKNTNGSVDELAIFSAFGMVLQVLQFGFLVMACLVLIIFGPIFLDKVVILARTGFGCKGTFTILTGLGIIYQLQRCIAAVYRVNNVLDGLEGTTTMKVVGKENEDVALAKAVSKLRYNQFLVVCVAFPVCMLYLLLAAGAIPLDWYWVLLPTCGGETCGALMMAVHSRYVKRRRHRPKTTEVTLVANTALQHTTTLKNTQVRIGQVT